MIQLSNSFLIQFFLNYFVTKQQADGCYNIENAVQQEKVYELEIGADLFALNIDLLQMMQRSPTKAVLESKWIIRSELHIDFGRAALTFNGFFNTATRAF